MADAINRDGIKKDAFNLSKFKNANARMISLNDNAYRDVYFDRQSRTKVKDYTPEEVEKILTSGSVIEQAKLSRNYFYKDGFYKRIIMYYATILKYYGLLVPNPAPGRDLSQTHISKRYYSALDYVELMDLPNFLTNVSTRVFVDGAYYGVIRKKDKKHFTVLDLPSGYCISRFKDENDNQIIEFDVSYFNNFYEESVRKRVLSMYPRTVQSAYRSWSKGNRASPWVFIPSDISVCFQLTSDGRPFFLNVIPATIEYDEAVDTEQERDLEEVRKIIVQKIPHLQDGTLLFEPEEAEEIHTGTVGMMKGNPNVSVLTTYADVDAVQSRTSAESNKNSLEKMLQNIYSEAGTSSQIFAATGNLSVAISQKNDLALIMILGNKYSKFITNTLNDTYSNSNITFKYSILPVSYYNDKDYIDQSQKLATNGYSFLVPSIASGVSQRDLVNLKTLENDVLDLHEVLIPLASSYTESTGDVGAPAKNPDEKSGKTIANEESLDRQGQTTESSEGGSE